MQPVLTARGHAPFFELAGPAQEPLRQGYHFSLQFIAHPAKHTNSQSLQRWLQPYEKFNYKS